MRARTVYRRLARLYPRPAEGAKELERPLAFLGWKLSPSLVTRAGYGSGVLVGGVGLGLTLLVPAAFRLAAFLSTLALASGVAYLVQQSPKLYATARRTRALGAAPDLVARAVLSMRLEPVPERAASFSASSGDGALAASLATHVRQSQYTTTSALSSFGDEWAALFPSIRRSFALVLAAGSAPAHDRGRILDRALSVVLSGTRDRMASFAADIRGPAAALYAFGVLLPIALIALLPAAGVAGLAVTPVSVTVLYGFVLPAVVCAGAVWLLVRRPVAFPPPEVPRDHPEVSDRTRVAVVVATGLAVTGWLVAGGFFPSWAPPVAAGGLGVGGFLWIRSQPVIAVYERSRAVESQLADALELVGRRVANGRAVETALARAAAELDGPMGETLAAAVRQQRQLQVGVREAFLGRHGVLRRVPSPRVRGSMALLALAAHEGRPAGGALLALAEHVDDLRTIEQEARHSLAHICRTLVSTGAAFAPMVAGATVAMAGTLGTSRIPGASTSLPWLGGIVGWYVLVLAVLLPALATGLRRGLDRALLCQQIGRALVCATCVYLFSFKLVGLVI
ncbi:MAG: type II secretion system protein [Halovenus sp.]